MLNGTLCKSNTPKSEEGHITLVYDVDAIQEAVHNGDNSSCTFLSAVPNCRQDELVTVSHDKYQIIRDIHRSAIKDMTRLAKESANECSISSGETFRSFHLQLIY